MSAAEEKPVDNILSLYRLEFYRKKNNWQFKNSRRKKLARKRVEKPSDLNKTYLLESCGDKQDSDVLNVAFIDADSDQIWETSAAEASVSRQTTLSQQWQHPINIWPTPADTPCSNSERLQNLRLAISQYGLEEADNEQNSMKEAFPCVDSHAEPDVQMQEVYEWRQCQEDAPEIWRAQKGGLWSEGQEDLWSAKVNAELDAVDGPGGSPAAGCSDEELRFCPPACDLGVPDDVGRPFMTEREWLDVSRDSEGEFMRGAHVAPHSSELDLSLPEELLFPHLRSATLLRLSARQLIRAQQHCAGTLTRLLLEDRRRQSLRNATCRSLSSYDELPTRDLGLDLSVPPLSRDRVLAGSHLPPPPALAPGATGDLWPPYCGLRPASVGRGRGRLL